MALPLVAVVVLGLAPVGLGAEGGPVDPVPVGLPGIDAGPVAVGEDGLAVDASRLPTTVPLPVALDTDLALCGGCPGVAVAVGQSPAPAPAPAARATHSREGPLAIVTEAPPAAGVAAGSTFLAGLAAALLWLARAPLGLFSRIEDGELAAHPLRRQALDLISANPGATIQDVRRALGIAWGTAVYHLGRLERAGLVAVRHSAGRRGHWPLGQAPPRGALAATGQALADLVRRRPGLSQAELAALAGIGAPAACKQLRRLEQAGLVASAHVGRARLYSPTMRLAGAA